MNDEYLVWAVVIGVVILALVYSWNSREHFVKQKCWGSEQVMTATTGYMDGTGYVQGYFIYLRYLGEKLTSQGKCSDYKDAFDCANRNVLAINEIATLDTAKTFCATANCVGIVRQPIGNGVEGIYIPLTSELTKELPKGPDGKELSGEVIAKIASKSSTTGVATITTAAPHQLQVGYPVTVSDVNTVASITSIQRTSASNIRITTQGSHNLIAGQTVTIANSVLSRNLQNGQIQTNAITTALNGSRDITLVPAANQFDVTLVGVYGYTAQSQTNSSATERTTFNGIYTVSAVTSNTIQYTI